ncbi:TPA: AAA family ATPase [Legionella pneumophila]|nr:AAA family ATPase [Legionella pneumophila]
MSAKKTHSEVSLAPSEEAIPRPRLHKIIIKNFRSIGQNPIEIELDDIVVLVGPNNAGKSSILRAYEIVMSHGSKEGKLSIDDFPNGIVDQGFLPTIELQTIIFENKPGARWLNDLGNSEYLIRELWVWDSPGKDPIRKGFDVEQNNWSSEVPWGAPNVANANRPIPHRIDAFATPEDHAIELADLVTSILKEKISAHKTKSDQTQSDYELILEQIKTLQSNVVVATEEEISKIERSISGYVSKLFPEHLVHFDAKPESDIDKVYTPFKDKPEFRIGTRNGFLSPIKLQGSGARRTLIWAVLKYLSDMKDADKEKLRPHVLLMDEPEICLHPSAIREARTILYDLPSSGNWQVIVTSHSPVFIDLTKDNTTIIRVFRNEQSDVRTTTLYRPQRAKLDSDDKNNMKLLNICDPYVHEFFFGGKQIIVEGDTEYTAFSMLKELYPDEYNNIQVIRARGKGVIPSIAKVLLQFAKSFTILHDSDFPILASGKSNPAWGMNKSIQAIKSIENASEKVKLVACKTCFEVALFGEEAKQEKPYNALVKIRTNETYKKTVKELFDYLIGKDEAKLPENFIEWNHIKDLE